MASDEAFQRHMSLSLMASGGYWRFVRSRGRWTWCTGVAAWGSWGRSRRPCTRAAACHWGHTEDSAGQGDHRGDGGRGASCVGDAPAQGGDDAQLRRLHRAPG